MYLYVIILPFHCYTGILTFCGELAGVLIRPLLYMKFGERIARPGWQSGY